MSIVLVGSTSGSVTLQEPAVAGTTVINLPATSGTMAVTGGSPSFATMTVTGNANFATSSGNVGIGTSSPDSKLHVKSTVNDSTNGLTLEYNAGTAYYQRLYSSGNDLFISADTGNTGGTMRFQTGGTERMRITNGGDVLVNTTGLTYGGRLQVFEGGSNRAASFQTTANDQALLTRCSIAGFSNTVQYATVDRTANSGFNFMQMVSSGTGDNEFVFRGDGNGYADGTWNNNGADYAEYFESATGQAISVGSTVVLENNKVRLATESDNPDDVIGVVRPKEPSKASMVIGNTAWNKWANKYLTDDFDRYIMEDHNVLEWTDEDGKQHSYESHNVPEDVVVPQDAIVKTHDDKGNKFEHYKLNPAWDKDSEYVNRENRDEWLIIGLIGQVKVLKGQVMGDRWKKMRDVSASVEEWMIR